MQAEELRDYVSPSIHYMKTMRTFVFGIRFGFTTKNPVEWQSKETTKESMRSHKVCATVSNSSSTSGKLVHAGYILMKAPHLTHKVRYLQSLRNRLPENTSFFDIVLVKRTPLEQLIPHLAIQCGENHVAPLTKELSAILSGNGSAVFLPRVVLGTITTTEQITRYFQAHDD